MRCYMACMHACMHAHMRPTSPRMNLAWDSLESEQALLFSIGAAIASLTGSDDRELRSPAYRP